MKMQLYALACVVLFIIPLVFVWNRVYKDGVIGRVALLCISFSSGTVLLNLYDQRDLNPPWSTVAVLFFFAVFLVWHLFRFHTRVLRERLRGERRDEDNLQALLKLK
jgi:ABC-type transport system involved in cytochrome c biogenesis permease subunit